MRSRVLIGASAWLLGAVTATTGSMIAVNQLAHGLFGQQVQVLGTAAAADADHDSGGQPAVSTSAASPAASSARSRPVAAPRADRTRSAALHVAPPPSPSASGSGGTLLESPDGSVMAACLPAGAYLLYWSPDQGFQADEVYRGPAPSASVTFRGAGNSVVMHVSCKTGTPVARLYRPGEDDSGGDT